VTASFSVAIRKLWPTLVLQGTSNDYVVLVDSTAKNASPVPLVVLTVLVVLVVLSQRKPKMQQIGQVFLAITENCNFKIIILEFMQ